MAGLFPLDAYLYTINKVNAYTINDNQDISDLEQSFSKATTF